MEATVKPGSYKLVRKIKDEKFDVERLHQYGLSMQVGIKDFQFCITDEETNSCLLIEDYVLENVKTIKTRLTILAELFENHHLLMAGFWKSVKLSIKSHKFSLVPAAHFIEESKRDYLQLNCEINDAIEEVYYYKHISSNAVNIFAADKRLVKWMRSLYPSKALQVIHQGSALIEGILRYDDHTHEKTMFCIVDRGILHVFVSQDQKLHYYNQFAVKTSKDYLKYIMLVFKEFDLSQRNQKVIVWGNIKQDSEHFTLLQKYIGNISFGGKPSYLNFSYVFDEIPDHQNFDLFSVYLCD
ncbi:MAG: DUF3822 family protein [Cyclobacteriaceae bacterium]